VVEILDLITHMDTDEQTDIQTDIQTDRQRNAHIHTTSDRAFPVAAARTWNSLSRSLTSLTSLASFTRQLKTELFVPSFPDLDSSAYDRI